MCIVMTLAQPKRRLLMVYHKISYCGHFVFCNNCLLMYYVPDNVIKTPNNEIIARLCDEIIR